jgi:uncharacterized protein (TIGR02246 family)
MRSLLFALLASFMAATLPIGAQTKLDENAVHKLPQAFSDAWARHDGHELANIMADDVDFVTVGATWIHGRPDFEKYHTRLLSGRFSGSTITPLQIAVRFLHPDVAVVHWSWKIEGDRNPDGTARRPRYGMMTMVAEKRKGTWLVVVSQNDNSGSIAEFVGESGPWKMALGGKVPKGGTFPPSLQMLKAAFAHLPPPRRRGEQEYG